MKPRPCVMTAALLALVIPSVALAADTGFRVGDKSRVHTHLDLSVGYDTNPDRRDPQSGTGEPLQDWKSRVAPGLVLDVPGSSFSLYLGGKAQIETFFGAIAAANSETRVGGDITAKLKAGSNQSVVGFELSDTLSRTPTFFDTLGTVGAAEIRYPRWYNTGKANVVLRPGGGALEFRLGYTNRLSLFDDLPKDQLHGIAFEAKYKFFPRTAAIFGADFSFYIPEDMFNGQPSDSRKATPYNVFVGLVGQITNRLSTTLTVGFGDTLVWTDSFFSNLADTNLRTLVARADFTYAVGDVTSILLGYKREVHPVILLDSYTSDELSAGVKLRLGRFELGTLGKLEFRGFGLDDRSATVVTGDVRGMYWFFDYLNAGLVYQAAYQTSDAPTTGAVSQVFLEDYARHQILMMLSLRY